MTGEILRAANNLPLVIRIKSPAFTKENCLYAELHYAYDRTAKDRFYPTKIWAESTLVSGVVKGFEYRVRQIDFGVASPTDPRYTPAHFLPTDPAVSPNRTEVAAGGDIYRSINGQMINTGVLGSYVEPHRKLFRFLAIVGCVLIIVVLAAVLRVVVKRKNIGESKPTK